MDDQLMVWATVTHQFSASAEQVFAAWLDMRTMQMVFFGLNAKLTSCYLNPVIGGNFLFAATLNGVKRSHVGKYLEINSPKRLVFTWQSHWLEEQRSTIVIEIVSNQEGTLLSLRHEMPYRWADLVDEAEFAWAQLLVDFEQALTVIDPPAH